MLPTDASERKSIPIYSGVVAYFPDAIIEVAKISKAGNDQHNPGQPLHWAKHKSQDQLDCVARHLLDAGLNEDIQHAANMAWRSMAYLQILIEAKRRGMSVSQYNKWLRDQAREEATACTRSTTLAPLAVPGQPEMVLIPQTPR